MLTPELVGNTTRMNVASHMADILLRRQLLQGRLILSLAMMKSKARSYSMEKYIIKASEKLYR